MRYRALVLTLLLIVTACGRRTPVAADPSLLVDQAVAATLTAMPGPTSMPIPTAYPTPTPADLNGLFCEYRFCIGHPQDMAFYDVSAVKTSQANPSSYQAGLMASYSSGLVIQLMWQFSPGAADPQFLLDLILQDGVDTPTGTPDVKLIRNMNVVYTSLTSTATPILPFGGAAAWTCGERVFAWKVYTPDESSARTLFDGALARFTCNQ